jgi:hypothetical protein
VKFRSTILFTSSCNFTSLVRFFSHNYCAPNLVIAQEDLSGFDVIFLSQVGGFFHVKIWFLCDFFNRNKRSIIFDVMGEIVYGTRSLNLFKQNWPKSIIKGKPPS